VTESSKIIRNADKNWKTMGAQEMKGSGWDLKKRLKGLRRTGIKPHRLTRQCDFHASRSRSKVTAQRQKKKEQYMMGREVRRRNADDSRRLPTEEGEQPTGTTSARQSRSTSPRYGTEKDEGWALVTGARAAPQEAGTKTLFRGGNKEGEEIKCRRNEKLIKRKVSGACGK